ncbi:hypothetical protein Elgi_57120 [Paenibacillus elgii]|nr:hypothetical protein Elgi_57120 [Paenibacillus elgii]
MWPKATETTALGDALLAGFAVEFWAGLEELEQLQGFDRTLN